MAQLHDLFEAVHDQETFLAFVRALAEERVAAEKMERENPTRYSLGGAHDWQNGDIASFLYAACEYFVDRPLSPPETKPSWRMFADFLWCGKIIE